MMPLILPTTTSGRSLWAAAVLTANTSAPARLTSSSASTARITLLRRHRRQLASDGLDLGPQPRNRGLVRRTLSDRADDLRDALHVCFGGAARRHRRRAEADATGDCRPARLAGHGGHAGDDAGAFQRLRQRLA